MTLAPGSTLGPYEIVGPLGAGGMGEVYRARDSRLGRAVAIKLLPDAFAADPERLARFDREARLLASLSHPHIAVLHGLESHEGRRFIVMELVEGESLAQRLVAGALPLAESLDLARQVASALEAAHEGGVVHRDLKPGNIMVTPEGVAKVLDFGLAKGTTGSPTDVSLSASPTQTFSATIGGAILGTAAYMSPEQARGKPVDRRTDIWAFGCVLFECLTGRQAFEGETVSDIIASILKGDLDWSVLPADTPPRVRELLQRCLERDARQRLRDIGEARLMLERPGEAPPAVAPPAPTRGGVPAPIALAAALALAALAGGIAWFARPVPAPAPVWSELAPPAWMQPSFIPGGNAALSPDGRWLASAVTDTGGRTRLVLRDFRSGEERSIEGIGDANYPFWSPDGRSIAFFDSGRLKRLDLEGGALTDLAPAPSGRGGTWSRSGDILFCPRSTGGLAVVRAGGGEVRALIPDSLDAGHRFPHFLPDGERFIVARFDSGTIIRHEVRSLRDTLARPLVVGGGLSGNVALVEGWLFFVQSGALRARRFDLGRLACVGEAVTLATGVAFSTPRGRADFTVAGGFTLMFKQGNGVLGGAVVVRGRRGEELARLQSDSAPADLDLSPDGSTVALSNSGTAGTDWDVWLYRLDSSLRTRLTFDNRSDDPVWSPDGARVAYGGIGEIRMKSANGSSADTALLQRRSWDMLPNQWTPDGRALLFSASAPESAGTSAEVLWRLDLATGAVQRLRTPAAASTRWAQVSPDGRWLAYAAHAGDNLEVFVQDFPGLRGRWQVSTRGGAAPRWRADGRELFYLGYDQGIHAVALSPGAEDPGLGQPQRLFLSQLGPNLANRAYAWDVDAAGERFVTAEPGGEQGRPVHARVVHHWQPPRDPR